VPDYVCRPYAAVVGCALVSDSARFPVLLLHAVAKFFKALSEIEVLALLLRPLQQTRGAFHAACGVVELHRLHERLPPSSSHDWP